MQFKNLALSAYPGMFTAPSRSSRTDAYMADRKKIYWLSQLTGWTVFTLLNIIVMALFDTISIERALQLLLVLIPGILLTHLLRKIIKDYKWLNFPIKRLITAILISSVVTGSLIYSLYFTSNYFLGTFPEERLSAGTLLIGMFNMSSVILLWSLIYFAAHYFENYKKAEIETLIWENAVKEFELRTLKSQLNPHFMFNAMNSIRALIKIDPQNAQTALTKLSNILRYSLKIERNETVPLDEELETVSDYLELETIRFEERLKYKIAVGVSTSKIEIPPMMVQTLVENGIKHGISKRTEGGEIQINSFKENGRLHIEIRNSGSFDPESLKHTSGFGIQNTKHRLTLLYGEKATFKIGNENNNTVLAEIVIPSGGTNK